VSNTFEDLTLEGQIDPFLYEEIFAACTAGWDRNFVTTEDGRKAGEEVVFRRHDQTIRHVLPWLSRNIDLSETNIIDFGSGCGSSALAFSKVARNVHSFEINDVSSEAFKKRMNLFNVNNVEFTQCPPEMIFERAADVVADNTSIMLVAVVEHLLENEQINYLRTFWDKLRPGQVLAIMETPNYLSYFDTHTFQMPFAHFVPDALFAEWVRRQPPSLRFRDGMMANLGSGALLEQRRRLGLGVTSEPFEQAFGIDLDEIIVGDGFDVEMMNWFPLSFDDRLLLTAFRHYNVQKNVGFCKNVLSFVFKKPESSSDAKEIKLNNKMKREEVISKYSLNLE